MNLGGQRDQLLVDQLDVGFGILDELVHVAEFEKTTGINLQELPQTRTIGLYRDPNFGNGGTFHNPLQSRSNEIFNGIIFGDVSSDVKESHSLFASKLHQRDVIFDAGSRTRIRFPLNVKAEDFFVQEQLCYSFRGLLASAVVHFDLLTSRTFVQSVLPTGCTTV